MGRQIQFYMLRDDRDAFLRYALDDDDLVALISEGSDSPIVRPLDQGSLKTEGAIYLWNRRFLPRFKRHWMPGPRYYGVNVLSLPVLEYCGSKVTNWEGRVALTQGRLYGVFDSYLGKPPEFEKWYERLIRWIRKNYRKSPTSIGGYLGPSAHELFEKGCYLLPQFTPPQTESWLAEIGKQHPLKPGKKTIDP